MDTVKEYFNKAVALVSENPTTATAVVLVLVALWIFF